MKYIRILNIGHYIFFVIIVLLVLLTDMTFLIYGLPFIFITYYLLRKAYIKRNFDNQPKIKIYSKKLSEYFELAFSIALGLFLIYNIWGKIVFDDLSSNLIFAYMGLVLLIESPDRFKKELIFAEDCIVFKGGNQLTKWTKINEYEIKDNKLMIRTPYKVFWIPFNDINKIDADRIISILNNKLADLFKGVLAYENELKMITNKA